MHLVRMKMTSDSRANVDVESTWYFQVILHACGCATVTCIINDAQLQAEFTILPCKGMQESEVVIWINKHLITCIIGMLCGNVTEM